ncbi:glycoside hydrolase family 3 C-terminal domain-containing protein [Massilia sp. METH4]|uniref:glycoside hydrolase family 3 C-terminal domain-containing protein n=1 Tax=Massilia sp. METH4 TaxID=3123041 RepID=UPI0030CB931C
MLFASHRRRPLSTTAHTNRHPMMAALPLALALACAPGLATADAVPAYRDTSLSPEARAKDLVSRMSLKEKAAQMQNGAPAIERLGLQRYDWWNEVLHGVARAGRATVFPQAIGLAATWNTALMERLADAIALEGRANFNAALRRDPTGTARYFGVNYWTPNINIYRDPRWGRGQETYGEDPHLTGRLGMAFIRGIQGTDTTLYKGVATPKHFVVHSGPEPERHSFNVDVSPFDLEDTYLPAFRNAIVDAKAYSLMCAYNAVDGIPMCAHPLQNGLVRRDWGFAGFIVSDCDSVRDLVTGHKTSPDIPHAAATAVKAGTDLVCGQSYLGLPKAVAQGRISEAEIDTSLERLMAARIRMGLLDGSVYDEVPYSAINSPRHRALAQQAAEEAIVLLKNAGNTLPLAANARIALIGPNAALLQSLEGNYNGTIVQPVLPVEALRKAFGAARVAYAAGAPLIDGMRMPIPESCLRAAADGGQPGLKGEYFDNLEFAGTPKLTRIDPVINFNFEHSAPAGFEPRRFSVRWTGVLVPPKPGKYELGFRMIVPRDRPLPNIKVWIDDELVVSPELAGIGAGNTAQCVAGNCQQRMNRIAFTFDDTRPRRVRIDYARTENDRHSAFEWVAPADALVDGAVAAAKASDVAVALVGLSPDLEGEEMKVDFPGFRGGDRLTLALPDAQRRMLEAVKATGKPLVVVYLTGGPISDPWVEANADAIVHAWYPGEGGGAAIARVLSGAVSPAGRLPYTIYRSEQDLPPFADYSMKNRTYRYFTGPVLHPFGHGLGYTTFRYGAPVLSAAQVEAGQGVKATVTVRNTGKRDSDEVVQLYLARPGDRANPVLAAFQRVHVRAGGSRTVTLDIDARALSQVDEQGRRLVRAGDYTVYAGGGQPKFVQAGEAKLRVDGEAALPK